MENWAVDCHVHIYGGYDLDLAVRSAWNNVPSLNGWDVRGQCWCLASPPGTDGLAMVRALTERSASRTRLSTLKDPTGTAIGVLEPDTGPIVIVPGTQAISSEGLEVLSLGVELPNMEKIALAALVDQIQARGGLPVVPWGVGKWLGSRRRSVAELLQRSVLRANLLFADNANRPWWWPVPGLLKQAAKQGVRVVSGSDPLPVPGDESRIASAGIVCAVDSVEEAWQQIRRSLVETRAPLPAVYGEPMSNLRFWRNQILLRRRPARS